jgi:uncharacterized protein
MQFLAYCLDKRDGGKMRDALRPAHLEFMRARLDRVVLGGPIFAEDGKTTIGGILIIDVPDRAACEAFFADEPYAKAEMFERIEIHPFRKVVP